MPPVGNAMALIGQDWFGGVGQDKMRSKVLGCSGWVF